MNDPIRARRIKKLSTMVSEAGGPAEFSRAHAGVDPTYVSQLLNGHRSFGDRAARNMEEKIGKPPGWLDQDHSGAGLTHDEQTLLHGFRVADASEKAVMLTLASGFIAREEARNKQAA